jgi:catecholate siderophore receptor
MVQSETSGFELQAIGSLTDKWFVSAGYTSLDASNTDGERLRESPENAFSIFNNFLVSDRLAVNLGVIYYDMSLVKDGSTTYLPDYTRIDAGASYLLTDNTTVQLNIENLTDELYFPTSHSTHQATVGAPINATFGITSSF